MYNKKIFNRCFTHRGKNWYKNLKEIPTYFRILHFTIKHGYDERALWDTDIWFMDTMEEILSNYRTYSSTPSKYTEAEWEEKIETLLCLLKKMRRKSYEISLSDSEKAKDDFFKIFSEIFYCLWD